MGHFDSIRTEEHLRARYRKAVEPTVVQRSGLLAFLNTSFGLFLLSTVFISSFSWGFNAWLTHQKETTDAQKSRQKLKIEILNRLQYIEALKEPFSYNYYHAVQNAVDGFIPGANVLPSHIPYYGAVFPEYQARSFISLMWELETLSDGPQREKLKAARAPLGEVHQYIEKREYEEVDAPGSNPEGKLKLSKLSPQDRDKFVHEVLEPLSFLHDAKFLD
jgi:hypothetical protein